MNKQKSHCFLVRRNTLYYDHMIIFYDVKNETRNFLFCFIKSAQVNPSGLYPRSNTFVGAFKARDNESSTLCSRID